MKKNETDKQNEINSEVLNEYNMQSDTISEASDIQSDIQSTDNSEESKINIVFNISTFYVHILLFLFLLIVSNKSV